MENKEYGNTKDLKTENKQAKSAENCKNSSAKSAKNCNEDKGIR